MTKNEAQKLIKYVFTHKFDEKYFEHFVANLCKDYDKLSKVREGQYIKDAFKPNIAKYKVTGSFIDAEGNGIDILLVGLNNVATLQRARTLQRNFVADYLQTNNKEAAIVAFVTDKDEWRFSLVRLDHKLEVVESKIKTKKEVTSAKRWSFLVGRNEGSHTAQSRFIKLLTSDDKPNLKEIESAFDIESVTKEFFDRYTELYFVLKEHLDKVLENNKDVRKDFEDKEISTVDFAKKTLGQIVFLYFLQKKGWFGVAPDKNWGDGPKQFIRELFNKRSLYGNNFFNDILEPLFYEALAQDRGEDSIYTRLNNVRMPFLNGGLFEPMNGYRWETTNILIPDEIFSNDIKDSKTGDIGNGILDVFDRYNFTVNENEPLEKEVAVDPEMLGKVFENLLEIKDRKSKGAFYTPREIVHYMCQETLINYLESNTENIPREDIEFFIRQGELILENDKITSEKIKEKENRGFKYKGDYSFLLPESIISFAEQIDKLLCEVKVADPAVGSGAFPLGMLNEIVRARRVIGVHMKSHKKTYTLKKETISNSLYCVDIDSGAVEITKLRLWLSLVVDENKPHPLPNLDNKIMQGNSLISEFEGIKLFDDNILDSNKIEQKTLGFDKNEIERQIDELQDKTRQYVDENQRTSKQNLREEIDHIKWDLIELNLINQKREDKLEEIKKLRKKNIKPFFIWKLEFSDVFKKKGGFDIVIGNPPYVKNTRINKVEKELYLKYYKSLYDQWDLYIAFFELGLDLLDDKGVSAFITPNQWLSAKYGTKLRIILSDKVLKFADFKSFADFKDAAVNTFITIHSKIKTKKMLSIEILDETGKSSIKNIERQEVINMSDNLGQLLSTHNHVILKINSSFNKKFSDFYKIGHSFSIPDFYELAKIVSEKKDANDDYLKLVSTGTLSLCAKEYGQKKFKYAGEEYFYPVVKKQDFIQKFPKRIVQARPKLIISSMGGLKIDIDTNGDYLGTRPTMWLASEDKEDLKVAFAILDSFFINWYYSQQYSVAGMTGFKVRYSNIQNTPFPKITPETKKQLITLTDKMLEKINTDSDLLDIKTKLNEIVMELYLLSEEEKEIVRKGQYLS